MADQLTTRVEFKPGYHHQSTRYAEEGSWYEGDKVRFRDGRPENIRGGQRRSANSFDGTSRALWVWADLVGNDYSAFGTECKLYADTGGFTYDITPVRTSTSYTNQLNTTLGSALVTVIATSHGMNSGDHIFFTSALTTIGGSVYLNNLGAQVSVIDTNTFIVLASTVATATSTLTGGSYSINYEVSCGSSIATAGFGWGAGTWGSGTWGTPRTVANANIQMRQWYLDNFGQVLIAQDRGARTYQWDTSAGVSTLVGFNRATPLTAGGIPQKSNYAIVSPENRHLVLLGTIDQVTSVFDPMLIRWGATESLTDFTASALNTAGQLRLSGANKIVGAVRGRNQISIWTDATMHALVFTGPPFEFGTRLMGTGCGLLGPHACIDYNGIDYWMGDHNFYYFDGAVKPLNCPVLKYVFDNINLDQREKIYAHSNSEFNEITWLYPSASNSEIDSYVTYNFQDDNWVFGTIDFTSMQDQGIFLSLTGTRLDQYLYDYEPDQVYTLNGQGYTSFIQSSDFDLEDGGSIMFIDRIVPDFDFPSGVPGDQVDFLFKTKYFPFSTTITKGPFGVSTDTTRIRLRARGRTGALEVRCSTPGVSWRMGATRLDMAPDGLR